MSQVAMQMALWALENVDEMVLEGGDVIFVRDEIAALREALAAPEQEPFGYFKAEPFGWTDCAETDEGAIALYERPGK